MTAGVAESSKRKEKQQDNDVIRSHTSTTVAKLHYHYQVESYWQLEKFLIDACITPFYYINNT